MLRLSLGILILTGATGCATFQHPKDHWLAQDKAAHFLAFGLIGGLAAHVAEHNDCSDGQSFAIGMGASISLGAGKEFIDRDIRKRYWSGKDFVWDIVGGLVFSTIAIQTD